MGDQDDVVDLKERSNAGIVRGMPLPEEQVLSRQQVYDFLVSERDRVRFCSTLNLTLALWFLFALSAWNHGNVEQVNRMHNLMRGAVEGIEVQHTVSADGGQQVNKRISVRNVSVMDEAWTWLADAFVPFAAGKDEHPGVVRTFNHVIRPGIQLRQKRVAGVDCPISPELKGYFRDQCRSDTMTAARFGPELYSSGDNISDNAFVSGGGFQVAAMAWNDNPQDLFFAFLRIGRIENETTGFTTIEGIERALELWQLSWMDTATEYVKASVTLFNPEVKVYTHITVKFTFVTGGKVLPEIEVRPLPTVVWKTGFDTFVDVCLVFCIIFLFFLNLQEVADRKGGIGNKCCGDFWVLVDWAIILVGAGLMGFYLVYDLAIAALDDHMGKLPMALSEVELTTTEPPPPVLQASFDLLARNEAIAEEGWQAQFQEDLELIIAVKIYHRLASFWYVALILLRFFRGFSGQPRIASIGRTVGQAASDISHLFMIVGIAYSNLVIGGFILFGAEREEWSTIEKSMMATISFLYGAGDLPAMYKIAPISTGIWGVVYAICIIILGMSMITAILLDHHREVRRNGGRAQPSLPWQVWTGIEDTIWKRSYDARVVLRFIKSRVNPEGKIYKMIPKFKPETKRISHINYDRLIKIFTVEDDGVAPPPPPPWAPVTKDSFIDEGIDAATAARLMAKCKATTTSTPQDEMPVMRLFEEFQTSMGDSSLLMNITGEELKNWIAERRVDMNNMEPRQIKLERLSHDIAPAEIVHGPPLETQQMLEAPGGGNQALGDDQAQGNTSLALGDAPQSNMLQN
mmetsp:Transcript_98735/g.175764  ORF Transcript_98735/g.175764 Transcript_98735/m.175764 type:complete len:802 (-) Transcript_98735:134-2539(-)